MKVHELINMVLAIHRKVFFGVISIKLQARFKPKENKNGIWLAGDITLG
jgi:hypothetical protein